MPNTENLEPHKFPKGTSGNPKGRPKGAKSLTTVLREMLGKEAPKVAADLDFLRGYCKGRKRLTVNDVIAARLIYEAAEGANPIPAIKEIFDRTEGKAPQALDVTSNGETLTATFQIATRPQTEE